MLVTFMWGSGHTAGKIALRELDSGHLALLRPLSAWLVLVALVLVTGRGAAAMAELRRSPLLLGALGVLGYAGAGGSTVLALSVLPAGITSLLSSVSPLMLVFGSLAFARRRVRRLQVVGAVVGFVGVVILTGGGILSAAGLPPRAILAVPLALTSAACWAGYTTLAQRLGARDALVTTAITSGFGSAVVGLIATPTQDWSRLAHTSPSTWLATLWAGGIAIGCAYVIWSMVLRRLPPASVLPFNYCTPLFSLLLAWLVLGEPLTLPVLLGAVGILAGVALAQFEDVRLLWRGRLATARGG
ncbi:MAG: DMT family transporter [Chloroflexota bacterium]|nr:DMT family transporter [Chloroflexota bacterium]